MAREKAVSFLTLRVTARVERAFRKLYRLALARKMREGELEDPKEYRETDFLEEVLAVYARAMGFEEIIDEFKLRLPRTRRDIGYLY